MSFVESSEGTGGNAQYYPQEEPTALQPGAAPVTSIPFAQPLPSRQKQNGSRAPTAGQLNRGPSALLVIFIFSATVLISGGVSWALFGNQPASPPFRREREDPDKCQELTTVDTYSVPGGLISINFSGEGATYFRDEIIEAVKFWNDVISNDLEEIQFHHGVNTIDRAKGAYCNNGTSVVGMNVFAEVERFPYEPEFFNVLGFAAPITLEKFGKNRVRQAIMAFELDNFDRMTKSGRVELVIHELGHALGIGTLWARQKLSDTVNNTYSGSNGVDGYKQLNGNLDMIPLEPGADSGTSGVHWDERTFDNELMTGYIDEFVKNPLSIMTIKSLQDLGYTVDESKADKSYFIPNQASKSAGLRGNKIDVRDDGVSVEKATAFFVRPGR